MVNLAQVIKDLRAERSRAQKEVDRLEKPSARFRNWAIPDRESKRMRRGQDGSSVPLHGRGYRRRRKRAGQRFDDRRRSGPEADTN